MDRSQARLIFTGINLFFGVLFLLFPRLALRLYGLDPEDDRVAALALRYVGARSLLVGAMLLDEDAADNVLEQLPLVAAADGVACAAAALTGEVPKRTALLSALTSAAAAAVGFQARE